MITVEMMVHSVSRTSPQILSSRVGSYQDANTTLRTFHCVDMDRYVPPESETTLEICLRVNHHLNMAYTVYHGASSAASLSVYFLTVPLLVSGLNR